MEDQTGLDKQIVADQRPLGTIVPEGQFNFVPIDEMFSDQSTALGDALAADPGMVSTVDMYKSDIDKYGIDNMASLGMTRPSFASGTYDPVLQQNPLPVSNTFANIEDAVKLKSAGPAQDPMSPIYTNMNQSQFLRYYNHPDFADIGFTPYANMSEYYNKNSDIWDDNLRMFSQYRSLAGAGLQSVYSSWGDIFDGDDYWTAPDLDIAETFERKMMIGNSDRGGLLAWTNNLALNSAYTMGILSSIAIEELALAGASAAISSTGAGIPAGVGGFLAGSANILRRGYQAITNSIDVTRAYKASRNILNTFRSADAVRNFYNASITGGKVLGNMFVPNTMYALKNLKTAKNVTQNSRNLALMKNGVGGLYRDLRMVNYAVAEAKMEAGMVYNEIVRFGINEYNDKGDYGIDPKEMEFILNKARNAGFYTQMANSAIIYASNWFVLGNALGGFNRTIGRTLNDTFRKGLSGRIIKSKATRTATGGRAKDVFTDAGTGMTGWLAKLKAGGIKGNAGMAASATLRYFSANIAEGVQEVSQEAISAATTGYYKTVLGDPLAGGIALQNNMILSGMGDQLSGEGFSVFMSGFLMGGLVQVPQRIMFQGIPALYKTAKGKYGTEAMQKEYETYQSNKEDLVAKAVKVFNESWNSSVDNPGYMFDPQTFQFLIQKQVADGMKKSTYEGDIFGFIDHQDFGTFQNMMTIFANGGSNYFREQLEDYAGELTDEELSEGFSSPTEKGNRKQRKRLGDLVKKIDQMQEHFAKSRSKYPNPYDRMSFKKGTNAYVEEVLNEQGYEHARYLALFTQDGFDRAVERKESIKAKLENEPLFKKMSAKDVGVLTSMDSIDQEIFLLEQEMSQTEGQYTGIGETNKVKEQKIKRLKAIKEILDDPKNRFKNGKIKRNKLLQGKLRSEFRNYMRYLASTEGDFINNDKVDEALESLVDYHALEERAKIYDKAIMYLDNPKILKEIADRQFAVNKAYYKNIKKNFEEQIRTYIGITEATELVNQLAAIGVYAAPAQSKEFLQTGDGLILKDFYNENGRVVPEVHTVQFALIERIVGTYVGSRAKQEDTTAEEVVKEDTDIAQEVQRDQDTILDEYDIDIELQNSSNTPMLNELLERQYRIYKAKSATEGVDALLYPEWRDSKEGLNFKNTFNNLKKVWASGAIARADASGNAMDVNVPKKDVISEKGFKEWFLLREVMESAIVKRVLDQADLQLSDIIDVQPEQVVEGGAVKGSLQVQYYKEGTFANILKIKTNDQETGDEIFIYKLVDKQGKDLSSSLLEIGNLPRGASTSASTAVKTLRLIDASAPDSAVFPFDGMSLHQGEILFKIGEDVPYIVLSTPKQIQGGVLRIVEQSKNNPAVVNRNDDDSPVIKLRKGQLKGSYSLQEINDYNLSSDVSRVEINEVVEPYPHMNQNESNQQRRQRYNLIISLLSPEQISNLEFEASLDPEGGTIGPYYAIRGKDGKAYADVNPYIRTVRSKYKIGIRIIDPELLATMNAELEAVGLKRSESEDDYFAYMPNEYLLFEDPQGNSVDPRDMTREQALNMIKVPNNIKKSLTQEQRLQLVHNNFTLNANFVAALDALEITDSTPFLLDSLNKGEFSLSVSGAVTAYPAPGAPQETRSLNDLMFKHADDKGNYLIYDLKKVKGQVKRLDQSITNLEGGEATELRNKVKDGLTEEQWTKMIRGSDRYIAAVLLPNGTYALVNIKPAVFTKESIQDLHATIIDRAQKTIKENLDKTGKVIDPAYNREFNDEIKTGREVKDPETGEIKVKPGLYITANPQKNGKDQAYRIQLQVAPFGKVQLDVYDTIKGEQLGEKIFLDKKIVTDEGLTNTQKIQTLLKDFNKTTAFKLAGIQLTVNNFRQAFADNASVETVIENTTTTVLPQVVVNQTLRLNSESADLQASRDAAVNLDRKIENEEVVKDIPVIAEEALESILDLSEQQFEELRENDFVDLTEEHMLHMQNKILRGIELSPREKEAFEFVKNDIQIEVLKKGGPSFLAEEDDEDDKQTPLEKAKIDLESLKVKLLEGKPGNQRRKILQESKEYKKLFDKVKSLEKEANKILPLGDRSKYEVESLETFMDWTTSNLPESISIDDITTLGNNLKDGGIRVGAFVMQMNEVSGGLKIDGTIYTGATSPFKYHEAFHGVYRMLLTDEEIVRYRAIARKESRAKLRSLGLSFKTELEKLRNSADTYADMTETELMNAYYEEYLADEFQKFKMDSKSTDVNAEVKSLFTRILDWIKALFKSSSKNELQTLFQDIDSGKYKGASLITNEFTAPMQAGTTITANALIPYASEQKNTGGKVRTGFLYLESDIADPMISSIAAMYLSRTSKITGPYNPTDQLISLMDDFAWLYSPSNPINELKSDLQKNRLNQIELAFDNFGLEIATDVKKLLSIIGQGVVEIEDIASENEDSYGIRTTSQYDLDASLIGGINSVSTKLKTYIATTTLTATDYFGNAELVSGEKLIVATDFIEAYNGMLKSVKNINEPKAILQSLYFFGQDNPQVGAVVNRLMQDTNVSEEDLLNDSVLNNIKQPELLQSIIKGLENSRVDYLFNERDQNGTIRIYSAAQRDDINSQLDRWNQAWISRSKQINSNENRLDEVKSFLLELGGRLAVRKTALSDVQLSNISKNYSKRMFDLVGIRLSPLYLQFSMIQNRPRTTIKQKALFRLYAQEIPLTETDVKILNDIISKGDDIFDSGEKGMNSRLKTMSTNNAPFDETIGASVFKNPNGDYVYAHQLPTYHLKMIESLNNSDVLDEIKNSNEYTKENYLLNDPAFQKLSAENKLKVIRVAGSKVGKSLVNDLDLNQNMSNVQSTQTYGDFSPQEFILSLINNYTAGLNTTSNKVDTIKYTDNEGKVATKALAPVLIRVMESSNTGDLLSLPVIKTVETKNGKPRLTNEAIDIYVDRVKNEYERIVRESSLNNETRVEGYNTKDGRAYKFFNTSILLDDAFKNDLENIATGDPEKIVSFNDALKMLSVSNTSFRQQVERNLEAQFNLFQDLITELKARGQISKNVRQGPVISKGVSRIELLDSQMLLNLTNDETHNLKQIFFNDWINTGSINEILLGDQAVSLSSPVDQIKRAKMQNAAYYSAYSAFAAPSLNVTHNVDNYSLITIDEPIAESTITGEEIKEADAQMYFTTKAFRYSWFGFGKLSAAQAALINKIEIGEAITSDEIFGNKENPEGYAKMQALLNSKKFVYADGSTFLKMSVFVLTPEYTSLQLEDGTWIAKPNRVKLHNLRIKLEAIESVEGSNTLGIAAPLSAVKMKKQLVNFGDQLDNPSPFTEAPTILDARYMGLQVIVPSNKLDMIDTTQIKEIATSEQKDSVKVEALRNPDGTPMNVGQIRKAYNEAVSKRVVLSYKNKRNLVFSLDTAAEEFKLSKRRGAVTPNLVAFLNYATAGLKASQSSSQLLEFFSSTDGVQNYNLNNPITVQKFEQLFLSYFSKGVLSERVPGLGLTLVSDFGSQIYRRVYEVEIDKNGNSIPIRSEVIREKVYHAIPFPLVELSSLVNDNIPSEGVVVLDNLRHGLMGYTDPKDASTETGERYSEMIMPAHFKSVMDLIENNLSVEIPEVIAKMFAVRIPSQDNHSTVPAKVVDFMPAFYGSTAMFSKEIVEVSGADFDIDKVFALIKEFYVENGVFNEYGKGPVYSEYVKYINEKVNVSGTIYSEALGLYLSNDLAASTNLTDANIKSAKKSGLTINAIKALQILGLPVTVRQVTTYIEKHGVPFQAPLNNQILDYRYALMANKHVTESKEGIPISYQAADVEVLKDVLAELVSESDVFKNRVEEDNVDVDNLLGKTQAFKANKGASIGAVVLPNLYLSLLTEYKIKLKKPITINGKSYKGFGETVMENGERKQNVISALITMATDNPTERLVSKLALNRHAVALLTNMISLNIPLKTSLLLINNPVIQQYYNTALNKMDKFDPGINKIVGKALRGYKNAKTRLTPITDPILLDAINNPQDVSTSEMYSILTLFKKLSDIKDFTADMGAVTSLSKGLGSNIAEVKEKYTKIAGLMAKSAPMDLSPVYRGNTWQKQYLKIFTQIHNDLLPAAFLTSSEGFTKILKPTLDSLDTISEQFTEGVAAKVRLDLLSYLTIKAYDKYQLDNDSQKIATLNNNFLYPTDYESVNDVVERLRSTAVGQDNFFLDNFVIIEKASDSSNTTGLNLANANTFRKLSPSQKVDLQNDFAKLYGSLSTKNDAMSIVNYIMVKDGLQIGYNSLIEAISPYILSSYLDQITSVELALKEEISYESVFDMSVEELTDEFKDGYLLSNINGPKLVTLETSQNQPLPSEFRWDRVNKKLLDFRNEMDGEVVNRKEYIRIADTNLATNNTKYYTFKFNEIAEDSSFSYDQVESMGSNLQTGIGFMFGERPSYQTVRDYINNNDNTIRELEDTTPLKQPDPKTIIQVEALKDEAAIITATNEKVEIAIDETVSGTNISDVAKLSNDLVSNQDSVKQDEIEANTIEDIDQTYEELTPEQTELQLELSFEMGEQYDYLNDQYDILMQETGNKTLLMENNLFPLSSMIESYENRLVKDSSKSPEESQKDFIDQIKSCILK